jgi:hypothetical protein
VFVEVKKQHHEEHEEELMSTIEHAAGPAVNTASVGRIASLNMTAETGGLSYGTLIHDMTAANDHDCDSGCWDHCHLWACAAVRG